MPMVFTDENVKSELKMFKLDLSGTPHEQRERLACYFEREYGDYLAAWEVRTGKPWDQMTSDDVVKIFQDHESMRGNPGLISRMMSND